MPETRMSLATLQGGAAAERFDEELARALKNIADPNTPEKAKRKIVLEVTLEATHGMRESIWVTTKVSSKLAPARPVETQAYIEETGDGGFMAMEAYRGQMPGQTAIEDIKPEPTPEQEAPKTSNVRKIATAGKGR